MESKKFPPGLKPKLMNVVRTAIQCGEYNERFISLMPELFPYNKFTMRRLIDRLLNPEAHRTSTKPVQTPAAGIDDDDMQPAIQDPPEPAAGKQLSHATRSAAARQCLVGLGFVFSGEFCRSQFSREELHHIVRSFGGYVSVCSCIFELDYTHLCLDAH